MRNARAKGRSSVTYQHKLTKVKKWYAKRVADRKRHEELVAELSAKKTLTKKEQRTVNKKYKELKPLEWYVEQLKKSNGESKKSSPSSSRPSKPTGGWW